MYDPNQCTALAERTLFYAGSARVGYAMKTGKVELCANFRTHEEDVGDSEADRYQAEQSRDVRPDEIQTLTERKWSGQDSFCLAL